MARYAFKRRSERNCVQPAPVRRRYGDGGVGQRAQRPRHPAPILVLHHAAQQHGAPPGQRGHIIGQRLRALRIMGAVQQQRRLLPYPFQARRPARAPQSLGNRRLIDAQRPQRADGQRGVIALVRALQAEGQADIRRRHEKRRAHGLTVRCDDAPHGRRGLRRQEQRHAGFGDAGLFPGNGFHRITQRPGMIQPNRRNGGALRHNHVRRIQPSAQPHFHHGDIRSGAGEKQEGDRRADFEFRRQHALRAQRLHRVGHLAGQIGQHAVVNGRAVEAHALVVALQKRGCVQADALAGAAQRGVQKRADRTLAVGAGHVYGAKLSMRVSQARQQRAHILKPDFFPAPAGAMNKAQSLLVGHVHVQYPAAAAAGSSCFASTACAAALSITQRRFLGNA